VVTNGEVEVSGDDGDTRLQPQRLVWTFYG
jgi:hypothetical protein